jgi:hypothetical protein
MIAGPHRCHIGADRLDDTGPFVAKDDRPVEREASNAVDDVQVAVAHPCSSSADQHLPTPRLVDVDRFDRQRFVYFAKDGSLDLHRFLPGVSVGGDAFVASLVAACRGVDRLDKWCGAE